MSISIRFRNRQAAIERAERITGAILNPSAKPHRRIPADVPESQAPAFAKTASFTYRPFAPGRSNVSALGWMRY